MGLRFRCLLIDHDDTAVDSTASVHYPAHLETLRVLRPGRAPPTLAEWLLCNFQPGVMEYLVGELGLNEEELKTAYGIWRSWTTSRTPRFYPGFLDCLRDFRLAGGLVAVISHSEKDIIEAHYRAAQGPPFLPDIVFGWMNDAAKRKPSPWPVAEALRALGCAPAEALIIDDLKPGVLMSDATGVAIAAAGWGHTIPPIEAYMRAHTLAYFSRIEDMRSFLLPGKT
jgi:beta-phosphoglucomutase-like phosphatase (HAD superfamily)